jgi:hypothetical protein
MHLIISSITLSVKEIPNTSATPKPGFDEASGELASDKPDSGIRREGIVNDGMPGIRGFSQKWWDLSGCSGSLPSHDNG